MNTPRLIPHHLNFKFDLNSHLCDNRKHGKCIRNAGKLKHITIQIYNFNEISAHFYRNSMVPAPGASFALGGYLWLFVHRGVCAIWCARNSIKFGKLKRTGSAEVKFNCVRDPSPPLFSSLLLRGGPGKMQHVFISWRALMKVEQTNAWSSGRGAGWELTDGKWRSKRWQGFPLAADWLTIMQ